MMRHLCKTLCLAGIILLYCATTTQAQNDGYYPMICRGGPASFQFQERRNQQKAIGFNKSSTAPRGDYSKITPGTCTWDDRTVNDREPPVIVLVANDYQWKLITNALSTRDQLWVFYVRLDKMKNSAGTQFFFMTRNHNALPPLSKGK